jgi:hypothetical protein
MVAPKRGQKLSWEVRTKDGSKPVGETRSVRLPPSCSTRSRLAALLEHEDDEQRLSNRRADLCPTLTGASGSGGATS